MEKVIKQVNLFLEKLNKNKIGEYTAGCAYYTILAFIPLLILILTLTKYVGIDDSFFIAILQGMIPSAILNEAVISVVKEVYSKSVGTITISAVITLWSAGKGFFGLCKGLNSAYEVRKGKNKYVIYRLRALVCTIIFILAVVATLMLLVFGNSINNILQGKFNIFSKIINIVLKCRSLISIIILSLIFAVMYKFIPKRKHKLKNQIPGAVLAAIACNVISILFGIYVDSFTGFSIMYGSLTTIVLAMMWVYACMYSILLGATINKMIEDYKKLKLKAE